jgi:hypothetical protein
MEMSFFGVTCRGIQKVTLTEELSKDPIYANSSVSIGVPVGTHKAEGTVQVITDEADSLRTAAGDQFGTRPGSIGITLFEPQGAGILTYNLTRVYIVKMEADFGEAGGQKPSLETFSIMILDPVDWNGITIVRDQRSGGIVLGFPTSLPTISFAA